jgi:hypothetical protein
MPQKFEIRPYATYPDNERRSDRLLGAFSNESREWIGGLETERGDQPEPISCAMKRNSARNLIRRTSSTWPKLNQSVPFLGQRFPVVVNSHSASRRNAVMGIPEEPLEYKKRIMDLARERSGEPEDQRNVLGPTYRQMSSILLNSFPPLASIQYSTCKLIGIPSKSPLFRKSVRKP